PVARAGGTLRGAPHPGRRRRPDDSREVEVVDLAAPVDLVARGVEARDLGHPRRACLRGRPEALASDADGRDQAHPGHHDAAGGMVRDHGERCSRSVSSPDRSTAANVSRAFVTGWPSTDASPRTIAAVEITFSATTSKTS